MNNRNKKSWTHKCRARIEKTETEHHELLIAICQAGIYLRRLKSSRKPEKPFTRGAKRGERALHGERSQKIGIHNRLAGLQHWGKLDKSNSPQTATSAYNVDVYENDRSWHPVKTGCATVDRYIIGWSSRFSTPSHYPMSGILLYWIIRRRVWSIKNQNDGQDRDRPLLSFDPNL